MSEMITDAEVLKTIEKVECELNALRVKLANKTDAISINLNKQETSTSEPKNALQHTLNMLGLPDDEDMLKTIGREVEKKNISDEQVKRVLESVCKYRDKQNISNIRGYVISCFRKYESKSK